MIVPVYSCGVGGVRCWRCEANLAARLHKAATLTSSRVSLAARANALVGQLGLAAARFATSVRSLAIMCCSVAGSQAKLAAAAARFAVTTPDAAAETRSSGHAGFDSTMF